MTSQSDSSIAVALLWPLLLKNSTFLAKISLVVNMILNRLYINRPLLPRSRFTYILEQIIMSLVVFFKSRCDKGRGFQHTIKSKQPTQPAVPPLPTIFLLQLHLLLYFRMRNHCNTFIKNQLHHNYLHYMHIFPHNILHQWK